MTLRRAVPLLLFVGLAGCQATKIPPMPAAFDTVVLTSDLSPNDLYAKGMAAFLRAGWEPLTPTEEGLGTTILPEGTEEHPLAIRVEPLGEDDAILTATADTTVAGARDVLTRTARILAGVSGELSYR